MLFFDSFFFLEFQYLLILLINYHQSLLMDIPFPFTQFATSPPQLISHQLLSIFQNQRQSCPLPCLTSQNDLLISLLQVCKILDFELSVELQKNRNLLSNLCLQKKQIVKCQDQSGINLVKFENQELEESRQEVQKSKKITINDTKNISKNFGKAVITFIQKNPEKITRILENHHVNFQRFANELKERKKKLISIKQLRSLWLEDEFEFAKPFREISYLFLRRASFKYIFGSRIADYAGHLKYRKRMMEALHCPQQFTSIKQ